MTIATNKADATPTIGDHAAHHNELAAAVNDQVTLVAALTAAVATDAELAAVVSTLNTAIGLKQDAATAATDAELTSAVATINAALALKQDAAAAATDTELAAAVATLTSAIGLKLDASEKAAASGVASLDGSSRVVQAPKLHATEHQPGGDDALAVDAAAAIGSLRTLGTGAAQAAQGSVQAAHAANTSNPHSVTATQVGLGNASNTSDANKPVSTAQQAALDLKAAITYVDAGDALAIPKSLMDAKGDLVVGTADNTIARKAAGTNEQSLVVDSAQTDGMRWTYPRMALQQRSAIPTGAITEVGVGRYNAMSSQAVLTSGTLRLGGMCVLPKDRAVASITIPSGSTAATTPTNQWFCLVRVSDLAVLRKTADDTTVAWAASVNKTLSLSSTYTPTDDELVYLGILVVAATVPTILGWSINQSVTFIAPITCGNSTTGLTTPASLGGTAAAIGASAPLSHYGYVS